MRQLTLVKKGKVNYSYGPYNKYDHQEQWIRITEGCPHNCPWCYEPQETKIFPIPDIIRNDVKIMDMNLLCKKEALEIIKKLGSIKINKKVVKYELICGIDYRFLTTEIAEALKKSRFVKIRLAWDHGMGQQYDIKNALKKLTKVGYKPEDIMIFMICNFFISFKTNLRKLDLCKVWNVKACDCYYDNQVSPHITPIYWTEKQCKVFRKKVRKHNQLVLFRIDPELNSATHYERGEKCKMIKKYDWDCWFPYIEDGGEQ